MLSLHTLGQSFVRPFAHGITCLVRLVISFHWLQHSEHNQRPSFNPLITGFLIELRIRSPDWMMAITHFLFRAARIIAQSGCGQPDMTANSESVCIRPGLVLKISGGFSEKNRRKSVAPVHRQSHHLLRSHRAVRARWRNDSGNRYRFPAG